MKKLISLMLILLLVTFCAGLLLGFLPTEDDPESFFFYAGEQMHQMVINVTKQVCSMSVKEKDNNNLLRKNTSYAMSRFPVKKSCADNNMESNVIGEVIGRTIDGLVEITTTVNDWIDSKGIGKTEMFS